MAWRCVLVVLSVASWRTRATTLHTVATPSSAPCALHAPSMGGATSTTLLHPYRVQPAEYRVRFRARDGTQTLTCPGARARTFVREERDVRKEMPQLWPVRIGPHGQYFIAGPTNTTLLPVGLNIAWPTAPLGGAVPARAGLKSPAPPSALAFYTDMFTALSAAGGNFARVWLGPCLNSSFSFNGLQILKTGERMTDSVQVDSGEHRGGDGGLIDVAPWIDLNAAAVLDSVLDAAERAGVRVVLVLDSFNSLCPHSANTLCRYEASVWQPLLENPVSCASCAARLQCPFARCRWP